MAVESDFLDLLRILLHHEVDFIIVAGVAAPAPSHTSARLASQLR